MTRSADAALALILLIGAGFLVRDTIPAGPYPYDEADYLYAASLGARANATDTPSLGLGDFIRIGLHQGRDSSRRTSLSETIRDSGDVTFYRHWHGPLHVYWLLLTGAAKQNERAMRSFTLLFHGITFLMLFFGWLWIVPGARGRTAAVIASSLYLFSYTQLRTAVEIAPHSIFVLFGAGTLLLLAKMIQTKDLKYWYCALVTAACAFVTLEVALILLATMIACCWRERHNLFAGWNRHRWAGFALKSAGVFLGAVVLLWPAALLRFSFVKAYVIMAYLAVARNGAWGPVSFAETWRLRIAAAPLEWGLLLAGVFAYLVCSRRDAELRRLGAPFLIYGALMVLALLRVTTDSPRYSSPFLPAFHCLAGLSLAVAMERWAITTRVTAIVTMILALAGSAAARLPHAVPADENAGRAMLALLRAQDLSQKRILVPQTELPTIHYYFPQARLRGYLREEEIAALTPSDEIDCVLRLKPLRWESRENPGRDR